MRLCEFIGPSIRKLRSERGLTISRVSEVSGIFQPNITRIELSQHNPHIDTLERLAKAIGIRVSDIVLEAERRMQNGGNRP